MNIWNVCAAFHRPKGIRRNSKRGRDSCFVDVIRVDGYLMISTRGPTLKRWWHLAEKSRNHVCVALDTGREWCFNSMHDNHHRGANHQQPCAGVMRKHLSRDIRCLVVACVQTLVLRHSGGSSCRRAAAGGPSHLNVVCDIM